ncbi:MAG TPA: hypothetical protein VGH55_07200, partial [Chthoniobacterales bacterium]
MRGEVYRGKELEKFKESKEKSEASRQAEERLFRIIALIRAPHKVPSGRSANGLLYLDLRRDIKTTIVD